MASSLAEASVPVPMNTADGAVWENVFQEYFKERKTNTDAIADLALENFEEVKPSTKLFSFYLPVRSRFLRQNNIHLISVWYIFLFLFL